MKRSALFAALFGGIALQAAAMAPAPRLSATGRKTRSRNPGPVRPAGSKLARMAAECRIGGRTTL